MNKKEYLYKLKKALHKLKDNDISEYLDFYKERIEVELSKGKSEKEVIITLETPMQVANNIYKEHGIAEKNIPKKNESTSSKAASIVIAVFLDLAVLLPLLSIPFSFMVAFGAVGFALIPATPIFVLLGGFSILEAFLFFFAGVFIVISSIIIFFIALKMFKYSIIKIVEFNKSMLNVEYEKENLDIKKYKKHWLVKLEMISLITMIVVAPMIFLTDTVVTRAINGVFQHKEEFVVVGDYDKYEIDFYDKLDEEDKKYYNPYKIIETKEDFKVVINYDFKNYIDVVTEIDGDTLKIKIEKNRLFLDYVKIERQEILIYIPENSSYSFK